MPRFFVNSMANFMIHGGMVSFTLQDQAMRTEDGTPREAPPETVADVVMREQDFANLLAFLNKHAAAFEEQTGRKLGAPPQGGGEQPAKPKAAGQPAGGMKIRPRKG
jgi:hypothetical protein